MSTEVKVAQLAGHSSVLAISANSQSPPQAEPSTTVAGRNNSAKAKGFRWAITRQSYQLFEDAGRAAMIASPSGFAQPSIRATVVPDRSRIASGARRSRMSARIARLPTHR